MIRPALSCNSSDCNTSNTSGDEGSLTAPAAGTSVAVANATVGVNCNTSAVYVRG